MASAATEFAPIKLERTLNADIILQWRVLEKYIARKGGEKIEYLSPEVFKDYFDFQGEWCKRMVCIREDIDDNESCYHGKKYISLTKFQLKNINECPE